MPPLEKLPQEIIYHIVTFIRDPRHIKNLCEVSTALNRAATPKLYERVIIRAHSRSLDHLATSQFPKHQLIKTKYLSFETPTEDLLNDECLHEWTGEGSIDQKEDEDWEERAADKRPFAQLGEDVMNFCAYIPRDQLIEFTWDMGTCVPPQVLGDRGCLAERQSKIRHLHLLTNGSCSWDDWSDDSDLSRFTGIRELSWNGLQKEQDLDAAVECLQANAQWLEDLDLSLCPWSGERNPREGNRYHYITGDIQKLQRLSQTPLFPILRHLALSLVSFRSISEGMIYAFNFNHLQSLKLWNCPAMFDLMQRLNLSDSTLQLSLLELVATEYKEDVDDVLEVVEKFLKTIDGLEDLYLMFSTVGADTEFCRIAEAITAHHGSLRKLVFHLRSLDLEDNSPRFELDEDCFTNWTEGYMGLLNCSKLQYMAGTFVPASLEYWLTPLETRPSWKVLHIRHTIEFGRRTDIRADPGLDRSMASDSSILDDERTELMESAVASDGQDLTVSSEPVRGTNNFVSGGQEDQDNSRTPRARKPDLTQSEDAGLRELGWHMKTYRSRLDVKPADFRKTIRECVESGLLPREHMDIFEFAQWAFEPRGLPDLRILAVGDFSERGCSSSLLCRNILIEGKEPKIVVQTFPVQLNFRAITHDDTDLYNFIEDSMDFFAACEAYRALPGTRMHSMPPDIVEFD